MDGDMKMKNILKVLHEVLRKIDNAMLAVKALGKKEEETRLSNIKSDVVILMGEIVAKDFERFKNGGYSNRF